MSQQSTLRQSRHQWKQKAKARAEHNRYLRKELERIHQERDCAKQALQEAKEPWRHKEARLATLTAPRGWLRLPLFVGARSSLRAVSRGLRVLAHGLGIGKAPCPQTVINWVMRLSVVRLQSFKLLQGAAKRLLPLTNGLIWMMDTSITRGTGKLLSVLALDAHHSQRAGGAPGFFNTCAGSRSRYRPPGGVHAWQTGSLASSRWWATPEPPAKTAAASCNKPSTCGASADGGAL